MKPDVSERCLSLSTAPDAGLLRTVDAFLTEQLWEFGDLRTSYRTRRIRHLFLESNSITADY